jgi:5-formyltetrahydrofolate cyclo-ligase
MAQDDVDPPAGAELREAKQALRARMSAWRDALAPGERAVRSAAIAARMLAHPSWASARGVLLTAPFRSEWDAHAVIDQALATGRDVSLPRVDARRRVLDPVRIVDPGRDLVPGFHGIPEPAAHCTPTPIASIDWVLVPGIAFDRDGRRLGYGGGYYDRLLPLLPPGCRRVAGAFAGQCVERVPAAPHDARVDVLITEDDVLVDRPRVR